MRSIFTFLLTFFLSASYSQTDYNYAYESDSIIKTGLRFHESQKYDDAVKEFDRIAKADPNFLRAQYEKALSLSAADKNDELLKHFEAFHSRMPEYPKLYTAYAGLLTETEKYDESEKILKEGEQYLSNYSNYLYNAAVLYIRKKERQKSIDYLKKIISINPNFSAAHYLLGLIALEEGRVVEGTIGLMSYLAISPNGRFAENAIIKMNAKYGENYLEKSSLKFSDSGDNFTELDEILRNQLPLKSSYKIKSEFDDNVIRQMQAVAEYASTHKIENGFFETTYFPWIKTLFDKNQFEGFSYYSLLSMEEKLGKKLTSQKKKIGAFYDEFILGDFWPQYAKRNMDIFGEKKEVVVMLRDGDPYFMGAMVDGKRQGKYKVVTEIGTLSAELNYKDNELDGIQKYYNDRGVLIEEKTFVNGKLDGERKEYYSNGVLSSVQRYKSDILNGISTTYHVNGGKNCEVNFVDGETDGILICLYSNGSKKSEVGYKVGKWDGFANYFNAVGDMTASYQYKDGERNGKSVEYYDGKSIKSESEYINGKGQGTSKKFYSNGTLSEELIYVAGKPIKRTRYLANGKKNLEADFGADEQVESYTYFDTNGNKYFEEKLKNGELKSGVQYSAANPKPVEMGLSKKVFAINAYDGSPLTDGMFEKGLKKGEWRYRYSSGLVREKENYVAGKKEGLNYIYTRTGAVDMIANYKDDMLHGRYENYNYGVLASVFNYVKDKQTGPYQHFHPDGSLSTEGYVVDGDVIGEKTSYWRNGKVMNKNIYVDDENTKMFVYDNTGKLENTVDFKNRTGKFTLKSNNGTTTEVCDYVNGDRNGKYIVKDKIGHMIAEIPFTNGIKNGPFKFYSPNGTVSAEGVYYSNNLHGVYTQYDLVGNLRITTEYAFGDEFGKTVRYYHNKNKMYDYTENEGNTEGEYRYYNLKGEPILILNYQNNAPVSYQPLAKDGKFAEPIAIKNENATIVSNYPSGTPAITFGLKGGNIDGKMIVYNADGKVAVESAYINNLIEGERTEFYASGKVYKKDRFKNGDYEGKSEYFKEDGKQWLTANYSRDELHGDVLLYTNGTVSTTKKYDSEELVSVN